MSSVVHVLGVIRAHFGSVYHTSRDRHIGDTYITIRFFSLSVLASYAVPVVSIVVTFPPCP